MKWFGKIVGRYRIHTLTLAFSCAGVLFASFCICDSSEWKNIIVGIGCSCFASALTAIFLERNDQKKAEAQKSKSGKLFFSSLHEELITFIQRLLWFLEKTEDPSFDWNMADEQYTSFEYTLHNSPGESVAEKISFKDAQQRIYQKVNGLIEGGTSNDRIKIKKVFAILSKSTQAIEQDVVSLKEHAFLLDTEEIMSMEESNGLVTRISEALAFLCLEEINYSEIIRIIVSVTEQLRQKYNFNSSLQITPHGRQCEISEIVSFFQKR